MELALTNEKARSIVAVVEANQRREEEMERLRRRDAVLEEDTYVDTLSSIIQRDYFPDLKKLRNHYEYNNAAARGDLTKMREIEQSYKRPRPEEGAAAPSGPNFDETPMPSAKRPRLEDGDSTETATGHLIDRKTGERKPFDAEKETEKLSLDAFLNKYTSEDNAAFEQIMDESHQRHKEKTWWMQQQTKQQLLLESSSQRMAISWPYDPNNNLMNIPASNYSGVVDSLAPPEIVAENTRIDPNLITKPLTPLKKLNESGAAPVVSEFELIRDPTQEFIAAQHKKKLDKTRIDLDAVRGLAPEKPAASGPSVGGYEFVNEPSSTPYRGAAIVTWGEIEGTPMLLDPSATPAPSSSKKEKGFVIPPTPAREQIGSALADKVVYEQRRKKAKTADSTTPIRTPSGSITPRSEAGQRLFAELSKRTKVSVDSQLRASYTPSRAPSTPGHGIITPVGFKTPVTPAQKAKKPEKEKEAGKSKEKKEAEKPKTTTSLTDDLLNL